MNIKIGMPKECIERGFIAAYNYETDTIWFGNNFPKSEEIFLSTLHHELLHYILAKEVSYEASHCLDNFKLNIIDNIQSGLSPQYISMLWRKHLKTIKAVKA